jgi:hypothetical protein
MVVLLSQACYFTSIYWKVIESQFEPIFNQCPALLVDDYKETKAAPCSVRQVDLGQQNQAKNEGILRI